MARVVVTVPGERVVEEFTALVQQGTTPTPMSPPPHIGVVEISQSQPTELIPGPMGPAGVRGSKWFTGAGAPAISGALLGDFYLDDVSGDVWVWDGDSWELTGTNIQGSPDTGPQILAKLAPVDGAGSGLDADTLDGHDTPYFATQADMTAVQGVNTTQDGRLTAVENKNATQDTNLGTINADQVTQNNRLTSIESVNTAQGSNLTTINADQVTQNNRMTAIEGVNTAQDTAISAKLGDAPNDGLTYGRKSAAWATIIGGAVVSDSAPPPPLQNGQLWYESDSGDTYIYVVDPSGVPGQWVQQNIATIGAAEAITNIVRTLITTTGAGTYTKPAGLKFLEVECVGGGGGGGGATATGATTQSAGSGGGGGGYVKYLYKASDLAATVPYSIGAGSAGSSGSPGGNTTWMLLTAGGGGGGSGATATASLVATVGGAGGPATSTEPGAAVLIPGGTGQTSITFMPTTGFNWRAWGGTSFLAQTAGLVQVVTGTAGAPGARLYGGGGGGPSNGNSQGVQTGAAGAQGCIILTEYY